MNEKMSENMRIGEWLDTWFEVYTGEKAERTVEVYRDARRRLRCHYPEIEDMKLSDLKPVAFQRILNALGHKYSQTSCRHIKSLFNMAYIAAMENQLVEWNPIASTKLPKYTSQKVVTAMTQEDQSAFEKAAGELPIIDHFALMTLLLTGLRRNELRFLRWEDWDKHANVLHIRKSKTENGVRDVPVIPEVAYMLTYLSQRKSNKKCPYIFTIDGAPFSVFHIRFICNKAEKLAHIGHVTPHMLRHSFATRMIEHGADAKSLSMIIGHSNVAFTLNRYVTVDKSHLADTMMLLSSVDRGGMGGKK